ncbi:MAG: polysaccharide biosynthesis tyrosine autokinase [Cyanobacteria bacterium P01_A01_bin.84]
MKYQDHIEEVDFQKYWLILQRRWLPAVGVFGVFITLAIMFAFSRKASYKAEASLLIKKDNIPSLTGLGGSVGEIKSLKFQDNPLDSQVKILTSVPVIQETINSLELKNKQGETIKVKDLKEKIKVSTPPGTDILQITYIDKDPQQSAEVVNKIIEVYIKNNIESNRAEAVAARKFILKQLPLSETAVKRTEQVLRQFKEKNKVISLEEEASATVDNISKLEEEITKTQAQFADITARSQKLRSEIKISSQQAVTFAELSQIPGIQNMLTQLQEAERQLAVEQTIYKPGHPSVVNLQEKVNVLNKLLKQRINQIAGNNKQVAPENLQLGNLRQSLIADILRTETERIGLEQRITELTNARLAYKKRANVLPQLEQTQRQLERQLKAAQTTYEALLTRLQEIQVAENQNIGNARVISPAVVPEEPIPSKKKLILVGGGFVGILFAIITAFALDLVDRSIKTVREAKKVFNYTLLGVIPLMDRKKGFHIGKQEKLVPKVIGGNIPQFPLGEAYQMLQANLKFLSSDKELKTIVITSSVAEEGKSEVAANLAVAMSQVGHRVLLVDAHMRQPIQHHIWDLTNMVGLSNIIVDKIELESAVQEVMENLYVLPSGVVPPNPIALLDSQRMAALINTFSQDYEFIIFDTPALAGTADAAVLGKLVDGILLVVRPGVVNTASASVSKEFLTQSGQNVLGMVINGVDVKQEPDSYFYYKKKPIESNIPGKLWLNEKVYSSIIKK